MRVLHHVDERRHGLKNERVEGLVVWSIEDRAKDHDGGITFPPVGVLDVGLDERNDERDDGITDDGSQETDTRSGRHADVPFIVFRILVLLCQQGQDDRQDLGQGNFGEMTRLDCRCFLVFGRFGRFQCEFGFLFTHGRPEFHRLQRHFFLLVLHSQHGQAEERTFHVECHLVVVELHDADQAFKRADLNDDVARLRSLANDLHDVIPFSFPIKVVPDELERVVKRLNGRGLNFRTRFLLSCTLNDGRQDLVTPRRQHLGSNDFADVPDRLQCRDSEVDVFPLNKVQ